MGGGQKTASFYLRMQRIPTRPPRWCLNGPPDDIVGHSLASFLRSPLQSGGLQSGIRGCLLGRQVPRYLAVHRSALAGDIHLGMSKVHRSVVRHHVTM